MTREEAILVLKNFPDTIPICKELQSAFDMAIESLSAERSGEWIWCGDKGDSRFMCSVCKCKENVPTCMGEPTIWDYCPNCGAKMKGGAE